MLEQSPQPGRIDELQHLGQLAVINLSAPMRAECHFRKHGGPAIRIGDQRALVI